MPSTGKNLTLLFSEPRFKDDNLKQPVSIFYDTFPRKLLNIFCSET